MGRTYNSIPLAKIQRNRPKTLPPPAGLCMERKELSACPYIPFSSLPPVLLATGPLDKKMVTPEVY